MGFGWFWDGFGWLRLELMDFGYVWMVFGWICEGWGEILDGCVMDLHGFWVVLGWTLTILETSFGFWIGYDGFWWDFGGFGWILKGCRWAWMVPGVFRMQMCILSWLYIFTYFQAYMVHLPS